MARLKARFRPRLLPHSNGFNQRPAEMECRTTHGLPTGTGSRQLGTEGSNRAAEAKSKGGHLKPDSHALEQPQPKHDLRRPGRPGCDVDRPAVGAARALLLSNAPSAGLSECRTSRPSLRGNGSRGRVGRSSAGRGDRSGCAGGVLAGLADPRASSPRFLGVTTFSIARSAGAFALFRVKPDLRQGLGPASSKYEPPGAR